MSLGHVSTVNLQYNKLCYENVICHIVILSFFKVKQENSGWPSWCVDEASRQKYIEDYFEKEGIRLDYNRIQKNPGLRSLAKLMLNR